MMKVYKNLREPDGTLATESLAVLVIDALVYANLIGKENFEEAVKIAAIEIEVRKEAGDY